MFSWLHLDKMKRKHHILEKVKSLGTERTIKLSEEEELLGAEHWLTVYNGAHSRKLNDRTENKIKKLRCQNVQI